MDISYELRLRLNAKGSKCFGPGVAELLTLAERHNSLRAAAKEMDMAYSKAHRVVKTCEEALGIKLLELRAGGKNGGGAQLTEDGRRMLDGYEAFLKEVKAASDKAFKSAFHFLE